MAEIRRVTEIFSVAPQIDIDDFKQIKNAGYALVVNNRPDGESFGQMTSMTAQEKATEHGLDYQYLPIASPTDMLNRADALIKAVINAKGPVLAYCRSGTRSVSLWSIASVKSGAETPESAIQKAKHAGYDLSHMMPLYTQITSS